MEDFYDLSKEELREVENYLRGNSEIEESGMLKMNGEQDTRKARRLFDAIADMASESPIKVDTSKAWDRVLKRIGR